MDAVLVGDSLGMVVQGHPHALPVTLAQMAYHTTLAARGVRRALLIADLPFGSYHEGPRQAVRSACRLLKAGAAAVKLEGGERMAESIAACVRADVPVVGHVGLTPQSVHRLGGFKVQRDAAQVLADAKAVEEAGAFAVVVECVPADLAAKVTASVSIPTIGIGAGPRCDGQVLVFHDLLGAVRRPAAEVRQALRGVGRGGPDGDPGVLRGGPRRHLPGAGARVQVRATDARADHRHPRESIARVLAVRSTAARRRKRVRGSTAGSSVRPSAPERQFTPVAATHLFLSFYIDGGEAILAASGSDGLRVHPLSPESKFRRQSCPSY